MPARPVARRRPPQRLAPKNPALQGMLDAAYQLQEAGSHVQAELLYRKVLAAQPGNPFCLYALGTISLHRGEFERAVQFLRQSLAQGYIDETVFTHLGIALQTLGRDEEALDLYRKGMKNEPRNPHYASNASVILAKRGDQEGALALVQEALRRDSKFAAACVNGGYILQDLGRLPEAAEMFERALSLNHDDEQVRGALQAIRQKLAN